MFARFHWAVIGVYFNTIIEYKTCIIPTIIWCPYNTEENWHLLNLRTGIPVLHPNTSPTQAWWRHHMETFSALLALFAGNSLVFGEFPSQRPVTRGFDVFFDLRLNKRLSKQPRRWWFETPSCSLWRHCNGGLIKEWIICCFLFLVGISHSSYGGMSSNAAVVQLKNWIIGIKN